MRRSLDGIERKRARPCSALSPRRLPFEQRRWIGWKKEQLRERTRMLHAAHRALREGARRVQRRRPDRGPRHVDPGDREQQAHERDAVADAMVHARDERRASAREPFDDMELPKGLRSIERRAHQVAHEISQRLVAGRVRRRDPVNVQRGIEARIFFPTADARADPRRHDVPAEALAPNELRHHLVEPVAIEWAVEGEHDRDDHWVRVAVHAEPCGIDGGKGDTIFHETG